MHFLALKKITSQTSKYVEKLPTDVAAEVVDLLDHMPEDKPYDTLKNAIIRRMGTSDGKMLHDLFYNLTLGHMTPSQLLRKIKSVRKKHHVRDSVKKLWTDKLHTHTTQILASLPEDLDLERVSEIADRIHENNQNQNIYATSYNSSNDAKPRNTPTPTNTSQTTTPGMLTELLQGMENLSLQVQNLVKLKASQHSRPDRTSPQNRRRNRSNSPPRRRRTFDTYWYHFKFGCEARKCIKPCNFHSTTPTSTESGKRLHRQQVKTTLAAGLKQGSRLFYFRDKNTGYLFLVDTGAQISVIPLDPKKKYQLSSFTLQAANGSRIETYGEIALTLNLGLRRSFP